MQRILVAMDPERTHQFAGNHALNLAKRINAKVLFLLILPSRMTSSGITKQDPNETALKKRVDAVIEAARTDGIAVDYYMTYGDYESELVSFVHENNITLLVVECPDKRSDGKEACNDFLDKLRHRINCRIEVVNVKPETSERKE